MNTISFSFLSPLLELFYLFLSILKFILHVLIYLFLIVRILHQLGCWVICFNHPCLKFIFHFLYVRLTADVMDSVVKGIGILGVVVKFLDYTEFVEIHSSLDRMVRLGLIPHSRQGSAMRIVRVMHFFITVGPGIVDIGLVPSLNSEGGKHIGLAQVSVIVANDKIPILLLLALHDRKK